MYYTPMGTLCWDKPAEDLFWVLLFSYLYKKEEFDFLYV